MTPQEYEEEKKFVLSELADKSLGSKRGFHEYLVGIVTPFKDDDEVMHACFQHNGSLCTVASDRLKTNKDFILQAVEHEPSILATTSALKNVNKPDLTDDMEVVIKAVQSYTSSFKHASQRIRNSPELISECVEQDVNILNHVDMSIRSDKTQFLSLLKHCQGKTNSDITNWASDEIQAITNNNDPVKALQASILHDKLNMVCKPKVEPQARKMKI